MSTKLFNSKGQVFYGIHFYPGIVRYEKPSPITAFINEDTIRKMNPKFAGCPVFVEHVKGVEEKLDQVRHEADGWVVESFFNQADGKTWVKFVLVTDRAIEAVRKGWKLSNTYFPKLDNIAGTWNGVDYESEVIDGEYEHLAIVESPRYAESEIYTPEQYKNYCEKKTVELKKLSNSKEEKTMKFNIFKRTKLENSKELELDGLTVELPKSKKEMLLTEVIEEYDKFVNMHGYANADHMVKVGEDEMSVGQLVKKHIAACNEMEEYKNSEESDEEDSDEKKAEKADKAKNEDDDGDEDDKEKKVKNKKVKNSADDDEDETEDEEKLNNALEKKRIAKEKARRLANANNTNNDEAPTVVRLSSDQVARGKELFG